LRGGRSDKIISSANAPDLSIAKGGRVIASQGSTDVFVVGGGPAGLAAAIAARQKGFSVIVADGSAPFIDKSCGEGLMPETLAVLESLGVNFARGVGQGFRGITFVQNGSQVSADFSRVQGIGLRRPLLHERLVARAEECGVQLLWKTPISAIVSGPNTGSVQLPERNIRAKWIVGADGQGSRVRRWMGLESSTRVGQRYASRRHYRVKPWSNYMEIHWAGKAQAYVTPIGEQEVCVVVMADTPAKGLFETALNQMPALKQRLCGASPSSRERGAVTAMRTLRHVQKNNVALLGDASGGVDAITGDGLRLAFRHALVLADAMAANDLAQYQRAHRKLARRPMLMGNLMLWLGRHPRIRARVFRAIRSNPELFARLLAAHMGDGSPAHLVSAGAQLGLRLLAS
jgi:menaquinone-9 beta-reductase